MSQSVYVIAYELFGVSACPGCNAIGPSEQCTLGHIEISFLFSVDKYYLIRLDYVRRIASTLGMFAPRKSIFKLWMKKMKTSRTKSANESETRKEMRDDVRRCQRIFQFVNNFSM